ncbi:Zinc finger CCCH domain-containing protein 13, partial [Ophiophagus hannah]
MGGANHLRDLCACAGWEPVPEAPLPHCCPNLKAVANCQPALATSLMQSPPPGLPQTWPRFLPNLLTTVRLLPAPSTTGGPQQIAPCRYCSPVIYLKLVPPVLPQHPNPSPGCEVVGFPTDFAGLKVAKGDHLCLPGTQQRSVDAPFKTFWAGKFKRSHIPPANQSCPLLARVRWPYRNSRASELVRCLAATTRCQGHLQACLFRGWTRRPLKVPSNSSYSVFSAPSLTTESDLQKKKRRRVLGLFPLSLLPGRPHQPLPPCLLPPSPSDGEAVSKAGACLTSPSPEQRLPRGLVFPILRRWGGTEKRRRRNSGSTGSRPAAPFGAHAGPSWRALPGLLSGGEEEERGRREEKRRKREGEKKDKEREEKRRKERKRRREGGEQKEKRRKRKGEEEEEKRRRRGEEGEGRRRGKGGREEEKEKEKGIGRRKGGEEKEKERKGEGGGRRGKGEGGEKEKGIGRRKGERRREKEKGRRGEGRKEEREGGRRKGEREKEKGRGKEKRKEEEKRKGGGGEEGEGGGEKDGDEEVEEEEEEEAPVTFGGRRQDCEGMEGRGQRTGNQAQEEGLCRRAKSTELSLSCNTGTSVLLLVVASALPTTFLQKMIAQKKSPQGQGSQSIPRTSSLGSKMVITAGASFFRDLVPERADQGLEGERERRRREGERRRREGERERKGGEREGRREGGREGGKEGERERKRREGGRGKERGRGKREERERKGEREREGRRGREKRERKGEEREGRREKEKRREGGREERERGRGRERGKEREEKERKREERRRERIEGRREGEKRERKEGGRGKERGRREGKREEREGKGEGGKEREGRRERNRVRGEGGRGKERERGREKREREGGRRGREGCTHFINQMFDNRRNRAQGNAVSNQPTSIVLLGNLAREKWQRSSLKKKEKRATTLPSSPFPRRLRDFYWVHGIPLLRPSDKQSQWGNQIHLTIVGVKLKVRRRLKSGLRNWPGNSKELGHGASDNKNGAWRGPCVAPPCPILANRRHPSREASIPGPHPHPPLAGPWRRTTLEEIQFDTPCHAPCGGGAPEVVEEAGEGQRWAGQSEEEPGPSPLHPRTCREERRRQQLGLRERKRP